MEEILASIRRIISEDDAPPAVAAPDPVRAPEPPPVVAAPPPPEDDVLELTEPVHPIPPRPEPAKSKTYEETLGDLDVFSTQSAPASASPSPAAPAFAEEPLVGSYAAEASANHFGALARTIAMPKEGRTLEDLVREMLKPLLRDWLDQNLSSIVEARVQAEVERISRRQDY
jgi:cell pole-organizing protein PopZ